MPGLLRLAPVISLTQHTPRSPKSSYDAVIIGAGHNGLACAALLARAGHSVAVFERRERIGGAAVSETDVWPGYTVSTASYVCSLLDPWLVEELGLRAHGLSYYRKDPYAFTPLQDGRSLLLGADPASNAREIAAFDARDIAGLDGYVERTNRLGRALFDSFSDDEPRFDRFDSDTRAILCGSAAELVERYVATPVLQAELVNDGLIGTYLGPRDPGTAYVLAHHLAGRVLGVQGAWAFVRGGMGSVSQALASAATAHSTEIFREAAVTRIVTDHDGAARGIDTKFGVVRASAVVSNAHPRTTFLELLDADVERPLRDKLQAWRSVGPSLKLNLALGELPNFTCRPGTNSQPHHHATIHVAPSIDYLQKAYEDARTGGESEEPLIECFLQTPTDASLAPPGKHILAIFAQYFPYDRPGGWTEKKRETAADAIVAILARYAPNLPGAIEHRQVLAPPELESRFGLLGGHIFHGELLPGQIYEDRFATRTPVRNLYLCGSGAHPGGCVSGFPGKRAARTILRDKWPR
ncbi:MAG: NAD(P)/FAD-dependent oxidoreductase [Candidatus Eremiobacteraeota bacterium]|nr:NAD(P)/FAD-dependent oxidoreductase [Candidatus Eremiobacteraeota bacterium]